MTDWNEKHVRDHFSYEADEAERRLGSLDRELARKKLPERMAREIDYDD
ncbi:MAG: hypothetical protein ACLQNE_09185 [Thermoguttaceae bacterium]